MKKIICVYRTVVRDFLVQCCTHSCHISCVYCQPGEDKQSVAPARGVTVAQFKVSDTPHTCSLCEAVPSCVVNFKERKRGSSLFFFFLDTLTPQQQQLLKG